VASRQINLFDRVMKILGRHYAESFLKLAFPDTAFQLVGTLENVEITLPDRRADFLHRLQVEGEEYLLHFEFQLQHRADYPRNVFTFSGGLTDQHQKPTITIVLYLERRESDPPSEYVVQIGEWVIHRFTYPILKLWDYTDRIRSGELREFAPLLIMLETEKTEAVLHQERELILQETHPQKRADSLATAVMIASRYFDLDWLWEFFGEEVEQMRESGFITDWIEEGIQQGIQQGLEQARQQERQQGLQQGLQQGKRLFLIQLLVAKFGELPQSVTDQIQGMTAEDELDQLGVRLLTAESLEEMGLNGGQSR
jgi:hypothetical protein